MITSLLRAKWDKWFHRLESDNRAVQEYASPIDDPKNEQFMNDACDHWASLGNNAEPLQPEDCDVDEASFENHK